MKFDCYVMLFTKRISVEISCYSKMLFNIYHTVVIDEWQIKNWIELNWIEILRYENGKLSKFWLACLDMVEIPLSAGRQLGTAGQLFKQRLTSV